MSDDTKIYGLLAEFAGPDELVHGAQEINKAGYNRVETYTPFAVEGIPEALHFRPFAVAVIFLVAALLSAAAGYFMVRSHHL
jgi:hypothetical protein